MIQCSFILKMFDDQTIFEYGGNNCLEKCNPSNVPYCITKVLIDAVKGDVENGLVFCGANVGRIHKMTSVHELMQELIQA